MAKLETHIHQSSEKGFSSVSTLITGSSHAVLIDPPFLVPDAESIVQWMAKTAPNHQLVAVFITHHHPDHYFSANPILDAHPNAVLYAAPYVCTAIDREYDEKVVYWPSVVGADMVPARPRKPTPYPYSFFRLDGEVVVLMGPVQGDSVDHTLFWIPGAKTVICGDAIYARSTHVWAEEIETPAIWSAWMTTLDTIESLGAEKIIPGHLEAGWEMDAAQDMAYMRKYLNLFKDKIMAKAPQKAPVDDIYNTFKEAFPKADKNLDFYLGHLSNQFGDGGEVWEENKLHQVSARGPEDLEGYVLPLPKGL